MRLRVIAAALFLIAVAVVTCADAAADGPLERRRPSVGYAYPAGGQAGTVVDVVVGGQNVRNVVAAHVSGDGVRADVVRTVRSLSNQQQRELVRRLKAERRRRAQEAAEERRGRRKGRTSAGARPEKAKDEITLPDHPLLNDLTVLSERQLDDVFARFIGAGRKKQPNLQIAQMVELSVEIAPGTPPGWREIRLETRDGITNPVRFRVGEVPEVREHESLTHPVHDLSLRKLPLVVNGQIMAGDVDRFRFRAAQGQRLLIAAEARDLVPYLADAVPGWFQCVLTVRSASGREVAFSDDFRFDPDPRLVLDVPADATYVVEIRDSIHRGREDFVYRLSIRDDVSRAWTPSRTDGPPGLFAASRLGDTVAPEREPNDDAAHAQDVLLPLAVAGRIAWPGDVDVYGFEGRAGDEVVVDVEARRLLSPLDGVVRLVGPDGEIVAWSDDHEDPATGLLTHHADPYLRVRLPLDGAYAVQVTDVRRHGGARHDYRLRVGPPRPDFDLIVTPSSVAVPAGRTVPVRVHAVRRDGFDGPIELRLLDAPEGFRLSGARIPAGADSVRVTLTAPRTRPAEPLRPSLEGTASIADADVVRRAVPADDRMQAFILRHLVPAQEWLVVSPRAGRRNAPLVMVTTPQPVEVPSARNVGVEVRVPGLSAQTALHLRLDDPPEGLREPPQALPEGRRGPQRGPRRGEPDRRGLGGREGPPDVRGAPAGDPGHGTCPAVTGPAATGRSPGCRSTPGTRRRRPSLRPRYPTRRRTGGGRPRSSR
jgi:hypothetical protein